MASSSDSPGGSSDAGRGISMTRLIGGMAVFVLLGFPLVGYLWDTLNDLLALEASATRLLIAIPVAALLAVLLWLLIRAIEHVHETSSGG